MTSGFDPERFTALGLELRNRIRHAAPAATFSIDHGRNGYGCASWRLNHNGSRELFVEQSGSVIDPGVLRVGVYFQDAPGATHHPDSRAVAFAALTKHRQTLEALGVACTFTFTPDTRDNTSFSWSDHDLNTWLSSASDNRDLVSRVDLRGGEPAVEHLEEILMALVPVWVVWNSLHASV